MATMREAQRAAAKRRIVKLYNKGWSIRAVADVTGFSYGFVHRTLKDAGVQFHPRGGNHRRTAA